MDMCIYTCPSNISGDCIASPRLLAQQTHFCIPSFSILSSRCPLQSFPICCGLSLLNLVYEDIENISCSEHSNSQLSIRRTSHIYNLREISQSIYFQNKKRITWSPAGILSAWFFVGQSRHVERGKHACSSHSRRRSRRRRRWGDTWKRRRRKSRSRGSCGDASKEWRRVHCHQCCPHPWQVTTLFQPLSWVTLVISCDWNKFLRRSCSTRRMKLCPKFGDFLPKHVIFNLAAGREECEGLLGAPRHSGTKLRGDLESLISINAGRWSLITDHWSSLIDYNCHQYHNHPHHSGADWAEEEMCRCRFRLKEIQETRQWLKWEWWELFFFMRIGRRISIDQMRGIEAVLLEIVLMVGDGGDRWSWEVGRALFIT